MGAGAVGGGTVGGGSVAAGTVGGARVSVAAGCVGASVGVTTVGAMAVALGKIFTVGRTLGKAVGTRTVGTTTVGTWIVGSAAKVGITGAAGGGAWGSREYHHGNLPGEGHSEAKSPNISSATMTTPSCNPSRLSLV